MNKINKIIVLFLVLINTGVFSAQSRAQSKNFSANPAKASKLTPTTFENPGLVKKYQQSITPEDLASKLYYLASDFFEGRETGARGQRMAAQYLAAQYRQMGLAPKGTAKTADRFSPASYLQPFNIYRVSPKQISLEVLADGKKTASSMFSGEYHDDLSFYAAGGAVDASGGAVFAGYGIADDNLGYNDYAALSAKGISINNKWVIMLADEPLSNASTSLLPTADHKLSGWTTGFADKRMAYRKAGMPKGILIVSDLSPRSQGSFADNGAAASLNANRLGTLSIGEPLDVLQTFNISAKFADQILASSGQKIEDIKQRIDKNLKPDVFEVKNVTIDSKIEQNQKLETENVLAYIEGSDPQLKNEVIVISAHYDHLGINPQLKGDRIFNGAADDGSGTAATLALAQAFMNAKRDGSGPRRSILFMNTSGEEKGIFGSYYYTMKEPVIPLEQIVADINMDGVGGIDLKHPAKSKNYIYVVGEKNLSDELVDINKRISIAMNSNLDLTDAVYPSDSINFQNQHIPFIYYSTGLTEYYHTVKDEPNTIDYDHMTRVVQLIFANAWQIANQTKRISSADRSKLKLLGYVCRECGLACDREIFDQPGNCPVCGMHLSPKYALKN